MGAPRFPTRQFWTITAHQPMAVLDDRKPEMGGMMEKWCLTVRQRGCKNEVTSSTDARAEATAGEWMIFSTAEVPDDRGIKDDGEARW